MRRLAVSTLVMLSMLGLSGCNTVHGLGQDISKAGSIISGAAK